ncbi:MAG: hypothetical protein UX69_C0020G0010 [candidate division WWE3 bacterium GW2011_GWA2_46_9]|uniref:Putative membrane protein insertion efficiency factor n=1 Tax=candidate division WWE3 bacterium GW2011_GWA2_46_9 TaxID=1619111 RepID=A0A0G1T251_UNCKA|nr:MAG: hypothetical protein UX69_C0020G0010 [candidate division WWE3 bacterium GW2011_GWA2_46_9]
MKTLTLILIKFYQGFLSPSNFGLHTCRFEPSCSQYAHTAINRFGFGRGLALGTWRVLRCNPLFKAGYDPVPEALCLE